MEREINLVNIKGIDFTVIYDFYNGKREPEDSPNYLVKDVRIIALYATEPHKQKPLECSFLLNCEEIAQEIEQQILDHEN